MDIQLSDVTPINIINTLFYFDTFRRHELDVDEMTCHLNNNISWTDKTATL